MTLLLKIVIASAVLGVIIAYCWEQAKKEDTRKSDWLGDDTDE